MSQVINNCKHLNTQWVDVTSSVTGEPMRSGYCPDCKHVALVPAQSSLSDADRETVLGVIAWLKGAAQGDRPNTSRGEAADALTRLLSVQRPDSDKDPMDWPLPCDVVVGHGTFKKGVKLSALVARMKVLYEMATGAIPELRNIHSVMMKSEFTVELLFPSCRSAEAFKNGINQAIGKRMEP